MLERALNCESQASTVERLSARGILPILALGMSLSAQAWVAIVLSLGGGALMLYWVWWTLKLLRGHELGDQKQP